MKYRRPAQSVGYLALAIVVASLIGKLVYKRYESRVSENERKFALQTAFAIDALRSVRISKPEYVRQEVAVSKLLASSHVAVQTASDKAVAAKLDSYLFYVQENREARDTYDEESAELAKVSDQDAYARILPGLMDDQRRNRETSDENADKVRAQLAKELE